LNLSLESIEEIGFVSWRAPLAKLLTSRRIQNKYSSNNAIWRNEAKILNDIRGAATNREVVCGIRMIKGEGASPQRVRGGVQISRP
jgi:hypothetical protein